MEYIQGCTIKFYLYQLQQHIYDLEEIIRDYKQQALTNISVLPYISFYETLLQYEQIIQEKELHTLATLIGHSIAKLHIDGNIIHGDLTTSNLMLRNYNLGNMTITNTITPSPDTLQTMDIVSNIRSHHHSHTTTISSSSTSNNVNTPIWTPIADSSTTSITSTSTSTVTNDKQYKNNLIFRHPKQYKQLVSSLTLPLPKDEQYILEHFIYDKEPIHCQLVFIDFGLASSGGNEERGVDLYVLERALLSTHANIANIFFQAILDNYYKNVPDKILPLVRTKFEQVRMRGRKRLAFG